jgi:hypothetical protein
VPLFVPALAVALSAAAADTPRTLSLVDATRAAMEHNPELAEASSAVRAAEMGARVIDAESALLDAQLAALRQHAALADAAADLRRALGIDLLEKVKP